MDRAGPRSSGPWYYENGILSQGGSHGDSINSQRGGARGNGGALCRSSVALAHRNGNAVVFERSRTAPCLPADNWHGSCGASSLVTGIGASPGRLVLGFEGNYRRGPCSFEASWKAFGDGP